jgi:hypothetical protein
MRDVLKDKRFSKSEAEFSTRGGPKISQKRRVSSPPADTTVNPSGLCNKPIVKVQEVFSYKNNFFSNFNLNG